MSSPELRHVAITQRVVESATGERRDALAQDWTPLLSSWHCQALPIPNTHPKPAEWLDALSIDALLLSGGNDPQHACTANSPSLAPERDHTERALVRAAIERALPILGVCRGAQFLNLYFGGGLHRLAAGHGHAGTQHEIQLLGFDGSLRVNSFHNLAISAEELADPLQAIAVDEDGNVEAFAHRELALVGVLWHPEREGAEDARLMRLLRAHLRGEIDYARMVPA